MKIRPPGLMLSAIMLTLSATSSAVEDDSSTSAKERGSELRADLTATQQRSLFNGRKRRLLMAGGGLLEHHHLPHYIEMFT